jgi:hypothetical protein
VKIRTAQAFGAVYTYCSCVCTLCDVLMRALWLCGQSIVTQEWRGRREKWLAAGLDAGFERCVRGTWRQGGEAARQDFLVPLYK